ncbi:MAG: hypothetical protein LBI17_03595 [Rickettsiales bacterium]|jgi:hypothetical protein|nr:hypothetical protein [Rickettsiales bacterium]
MTEDEILALDYSAALALLLQNQKKLVKVVKRDVFSPEINPLRAEHKLLSDVVMEKQPVIGRLIFEPGFYIEH